MILRRLEAYNSFRMLVLIVFDNRLSVSTIKLYYLLCNNNDVRNISMLLDCFRQKFEKLPRGRTIPKHRDDRPKTRVLNFTLAVGVCLILIQYLYNNQLH